MTRAESLALATMVPEVPFLAPPESAEGRTYLALKQLPEDYRIYHSVSYRLAGAGRPSREGEIDFLVLRPGDGILCLEVKGGQIAYDGRSYGWISKDRSGATHRIADPFRQAQVQSKDLVSEIGQRKPWGDKPPVFAHGYGVVFPDSEYVLLNEPIAAPRELVIDAGDLAGRLEPRIKEIFRFWTRPGSEPLTKRQIKQLGQQVLAPHFELTLSVNAAIEWEERSLALLDEEQSICLEFLGLNGRALVEGGAGTGKTLIACETVRRLASQGADVLFLCFNRALGHKLRRTCDSWEGLPGRIWTGAFHELCREWAEKAGLEWTEPHADQGVATEGFWNLEANTLLRQASAVRLDRFDALVVDEAQDFHGEWWTTLQVLLRDPDLARVALFADPGQDLWSRASIPAWNLARFLLRTNQRNTRSIARVVGDLGAVSFRNSVRSPEGEPPRLIRYETAEEERREVEKLLIYLFRQGVKPAQIAVIGTRRIEKSFLATTPCIAGCQIETMDDSGEASSAGALRYATPGRFKGLEADAVLLCDVDTTGPRCSSRALYVAASRARHRLYAFVKTGVESDAIGSLPDSVIGKGD